MLLSRIPKVSQYKDQVEFGLRQTEFNYIMKIVYFILTSHMDNMLLPQPYAQYGSLKVNTPLRSLRKFHINLVYFMFEDRFFLYIAKSSLRLES
jgi:hypothetical protein